MTAHNPNCDGAHCKADRGEVRTLPTGGDSNAILCRSCFAYELSFRRDRNRELAPFARFDLPDWFDLAEYPPE
jgi:hypothetical protein